VELTITLDLPLQPFKQIALEFDNLAASQAGHVDMVALRTALVIVLFPLHVHEIKFIHQTVPLEQAEGAVDGHAVDVRIKAPSVTQYLAGIEVLFGGLDHAQNGASLSSHTQAARHEFRLQASGGFGLGQGHRLFSLLILNCNYTGDQRQRLRLDGGQVFLCSSAQASADLV
jgi:hypothetical protein